MAFDIKNKVALITGGASGIGLRYAIELLKNGAKGITLADVNEEYGTKALQEIESMFGPNKAFFVLTDVTNKDSFENAFKKTVENFGNLDILVNNAGILNDSVWEKEIAINLNGTLNGVLLGLDHYIPKYKSGPEGVIVNISSIAGLRASNCFPIYSTTKFGVIAMTKAFGDDAHYTKTSVKLVALCPGVTETPMVVEMSGRTLGPRYENILDQYKEIMYMQRPESVALALVHIVKNAKSGSVWVAEEDKEPYEYVHPPRKDFAPK